MNQLFPDIIGYDGFTQSQAVFDREVASSTVAPNIKSAVDMFEAEVWGNDSTEKMVSQVGKNFDALEFQIVGAQVTADVTVGPARDAPKHLIHTEAALQSAVLGVQDTYLGVAENYIDKTVYGSGLDLGAAVHGTTHTVTTDVYGQNLFAAITVAPTRT